MKRTMTYGNTASQWHPRQILIALTVVVAIGLLGWYGYFQAQALILGPVITIESPTDGTVTDDEMITIHGTARNISSITLNGFPITISPEGEFIERLPVSGRYTIIEIEGTDRFGTTHKESRRILSSMESIDALERDVYEEIEALEAAYEEREVEHGEIRYTQEHRETVPEEDINEVLENQAELSGERGEEEVGEENI